MDNLPRLPITDGNDLQYVQNVLCNLADIGPPILWHSLRCD